jgi:hypothetical protein
MELRKQRQRRPERNPLDPNYRRLRYVRYADDFCLGLAGSREEAEEIKGNLKTFLQDQLKLELSQEKTLITHASTQPAHFLGDELVVQYRDDKRDHTDRRCINGHVGLRVPAKVIESISSQNPGTQAQAECYQIGPEISGQGGNRAWTYQVPGNHRPTRGKETACGTIWGIPLRRQSHAILSDHLVSITRKPARN